MTFLLILKHCADVPYLLLSIKSWAHFLLVCQQNCTFLECLKSTSWKLEAVLDVQLSMRYYTRRASRRMTTLTSYCIVYCSSLQTSVLQLMFWPTPQFAVEEAWRPKPREKESSGSHRFWMWQFLPWFLSPIGSVKILFVLRLQSQFFKYWLTCLYDPSAALIFNCMR